MRAGGVDGIGSGSHHHRRHGGLCHDVTWSSGFDS